MIFTSKSCVESYFACGSIKSQGFGFEISFLSNDNDDCDALVDARDAYP